MKGIIRTISYNNLIKYKENESETYYISDACGAPDGKLLNGLLPPKCLVQFWKHSTQSDADWAVCKKIYEELLQGTEAQRDLIFLSILAKKSKAVNVVCSCCDCTKCIRSLVYNNLAEMSVSVFLD